MLDDEYYKSCYVRFRCFFLPSFCLLFALLYFLSSDELDFLNDESDNDGYESGSSGSYSFHAFSLRFDNSFGSFSGLRSEVFVPTGVDPKCDIFAFDVFLPTGGKSKGG